ncbi:MAG: Ig-like domain-containing protein, partial [Candidatus Kariarchaeaceae archaeon]
MIRIDKSDIQIFKKQLTEQCAKVKPTFSRLYQKYNNKQARKSLGIFSFTLFVLFMFLSSSIINHRGFPAVFNPSHSKTIFYESFSYPESVSDWGGTHDYYFNGITTDGVIITPDMHSSSTSFPLVMSDGYVDLLWDQQSDLILEIKAYELSRDESSEVQGVQIRDADLNRLIYQTPEDYAPTGDLEYFRVNLVEFFVGLEIDSISIIIAPNSVVSQISLTSEIDQYSALHDSHFGDKDGNGIISISPEESTLPLSYKGFSQQHNLAFDRLVWSYGSYERWASDYQNAREAIVVDDGSSGFTVMDTGSTFKVPFAETVKFNFAVSASDPNGLLTGSSLQSISWQLTLIDQLGNQNPLISDYYSTITTAHSPRASSVDLSDYSGQYCKLRFEASATFYEGSPQDDDYLYLVLLDLGVSYQDSSAIYETNQIVKAADSSYVNRKNSFIEEQEFPSGILSEDNAVLNDSETETHEVVLAEGEGTLISNIYSNEFITYSESFDDGIIWDEWENKIPSTDWYAGDQWLRPKNNALSLLLLKDLDEYGELYDIRLTSQIKVPTDGLLENRAFGLMMDCYLDEGLVYGFIAGIKYDQFGSWDAFIRYLGGVDPATTIDFSSGNLATAEFEVSLGAELNLGFSKIIDFQGKGHFTLTINDQEVVSAVKANQAYGFLAKQMGFFSQQAGHGLLDSYAVTFDNFEISSRLSSELEPTRYSIYVKNFGYKPVVLAVVSDLNPEISEYTIGSITIPANSGWGWRSVTLDYNKANFFYWNFRLKIVKRNYLEDGVECKHQLVALLAARCSAATQENEYRPAWDFYSLGQSSVVEDNLLVNKNHESDYQSSTYLMNNASLESLEGWEIDSYSANVNDEPTVSSSNIHIEGAYSARFKVEYTDTELHEAHWASLSQTVDLTDVDKLSFWVQSSDLGGATDAHFYINIDGIDYDVVTSDSDWLGQEIDLSEITGLQEITFKLTLAYNTASGINCYLDKIELERYVLPFDSTYDFILGEVGEIIDIGLTAKALYHEDQTGMIHPLRIMLGVRPLGSLDSFVYYEEVTWVEANNEMASHTFSIQLIEDCSAYEVIIALDPTSEIQLSISHVLQNLWTGPIPSSRDGVDMRANNKMASWSDDFDSVSSDGYIGSSDTFSETVLYSSEQWTQIEADLPWTLSTYYANSGASSFYGTTNYPTQFYDPSIDYIYDSDFSSSSDYASLELNSPWTFEDDLQGWSSSDSDLLTYQGALKIDPLDFSNCSILFNGAIDASIYRFLTFNARFVSPSANYARLIGVGDGLLLPDIYNMRNSSAWDNWIIGNSYQSYSIDLGLSSQWLNSENKLELYFGYLDGINGSYEAESYLLIDQIQLLRPTSYSEIADAIDYSEDDEGVTGLDNLTYDNSTGSIYGNCTSGVLQQNITLSTPFDINADLFPYLTLDIYADNASVVLQEIRLGDEKLVDVHSSINSTGYLSYLIDLSSSSLWSGLLTDVNLVIVLTKINSTEYPYFGSFAGNETIYIDAVGLTNRFSSRFTPDWDFDCRDGWEATGETTILGDQLKITPEEAEEFTLSHANLAINASLYNYLTLSLAYFGSDTLYLKRIETESETVWINNFANDTLYQVGLDYHTFQIKIDSVPWTGTIETLKLVFAKVNGSSFNEDDIFLDFIILTKTGLNDLAIDEVEYSGDMSSVYVPTLPVEGEYSIAGTMDMVDVSQSFVEFFLPASMGDWFFEVSNSGTGTSYSCLINTTDYYRGYKAYQIFDLGNLISRTGTDYSIDGWKIYTLDASVYLYLDYIHFYSFPDWPFERGGTDRPVEAGLKLDATGNLLFINDPVIHSADPISSDSYYTFSIPLLNNYGEELILNNYDALSLDLACFDKITEGTIFSVGLYSEDENGLILQQFLHQSRYFGTVRRVIDSSLNEEAVTLKLNISSSGILVLSSLSLMGILEFNVTANDLYGDYTSPSYSEIIGIDDNGYPIYLGLTDDIGLARGGGGIAPISVSITSPSSGSTVSGTITVRGTASCSASITQMKIYIDGSLKKNQVIFGRTYIIYSWNTLGYSEGTHYIKVYAYNIYSESSYRQITVTVNNADTTPPSICDFELPATNQVFTSSSVLLKVHAYDAGSGVDRVEFSYRPAGTTQNFVYLGADSNQGDNYWYYTGSFNDGYWEVRAKAIDEEDNYAYDYRTFYVVIPPTVTLSTPVNGGTFTDYSAGITISGTASDNNKIVKVEYLIDGVVRHYQTFSSSSVSYSWLWYPSSTGDADDGSHTIKIRVYDETITGQGFRTADSATHTVYFNIPPSVFTINGPTSITSSGAYTISGLTDNMAISQVIWQIKQGSGSWQTKATLTSGDWSWTWNDFNSHPHPDGTYSIRVIAYDSDSPANTRTITWSDNSITVRINPIASITSPSSDYSLTLDGTASYTFYAQATDNTGLSSVVMKIYDPDGLLFTTLNVGGTYPSYSGVWSSQSIATITKDGTYRLQVTVTDSSSYSLITVKNRYFTVGLAPEVSIVSPSIAYTFNTGSGSGYYYTFKASVSDNDHISSVRYYVNGGYQGVGALVGDYYQWIYNNIAFTDGQSFVLKVQAEDDQGNIKEVTKTITVQNSPYNVVIADSGVITTHSVTISVAALDDVAVEEMKFYLSTSTTFGSTPDYTDSTIGSWTWLWDTSNVAEGTYYIKAVASDYAGNSREHIRSVVVAINPVIESFAPIEGTIYDEIDNIQITIASSDNTDVTLLQIFIDDITCSGTATHSVSTPIASYTWFWDATTLFNDDNEHTITVRIFDAAGNYAIETHTVNFNVEPDQAQFLAPLYVSGQTKTISVSPYTLIVEASDNTGVDHVTFSVKEVGAPSFDLIDTDYNSANNWDIVWDVNSFSFADGTHVILQAEVFDAELNSISITQEVIVNILPEISIETIGTIDDTTDLISVHASDNEVLTSVSAAFYESQQAYDYGTPLKPELAGLALTFISGDLYRLEPFAFSELPDGNLLVVVSVVDSFGGTAENQQFFNVAVNPEVTEICNGARTFGSTSVLLTADIWDNGKLGVSQSAIDFVEFFVDGQSIGTDSVADSTTLPNEEFSFLWSGIQDGDYLINVVVHDLDGRTGSMDCTISIRIAPTITYFGPSTDQIFGYTILTVSAEDDTDVTGVEFFADSVSQGIVTDTNANGDWLLNYTTSSPDNTPINFEARAYDAYGLFDSSFKTMYSFIAPEVEITSPSDMSFFNQSVEITVEASDTSNVDRLEFWTGEQSLGVEFEESIDFGTPTVTHSWLWDTSAIVWQDNLVYAIEVHAFDIYNIESISFIHLILTDPPEVTITTGGTVISSLMDIQLDVTDNSEIDHVDLKLDNLLLETFNVASQGLTTAQFIHSFDPTVFDDGFYNLTAIAFDSSNNFVITLLEIEISVLPTIDFNNLEDGSIISDIQSIRTNVWDNSGISRVEFFIDGVSKANVTSSPFDWAWSDCYDYQDGNHVITARIFDDYSSNNFAEKTITISLQLAPELIILSPIATNNVSGLITIEFEAFDNNGEGMTSDEVVQTEIYIDNINVMTDSSFPATQTWDWNTSNWSMGYRSNVKIEVIVYDEFMNQASEIIYVNIDNLDHILPYIDLLTPTAEEILYYAVDGQEEYSLGTHEISAYIIDSHNISSVYLYIHITGEEWSNVEYYALEMVGEVDAQGRPIVSVNCTWLWETWDQATNTALWEDGEYTITIVAYDGAGNERIISQEVTLDNKDYIMPEIVIHSPEFGFTMEGIIDVSFTVSDNRALYNASFYIINCLTGEVAFYAPVIYSLRGSFTLFETFSYSWDSNEFEDGVYNFRIVIEDENTEFNHLGGIIEGGRFEELDTLIVISNRPAFGFSGDFIGGDIHLYSNDPETSTISIIQPLETKYIEETSSFNLVFETVSLSNNVELVIELYDATQVDQENQDPLWLEVFHEDQLIDGVRHVTIEGILSNMRQIRITVISGEIIFKGFRFTERSDWEVIAGETILPSQYIEEGFSDEELELSLDGSDESINFSADYDIVASSFANISYFDGTLKLNYSDFIVRFDMADQLVNSNDFPDEFAVLLASDGLTYGFVFNDSRLYIKINETYFDFGPVGTQLVNGTFLHLPDTRSYEFLFSNNLFSATINGLIYASLDVSLSLTNFTVQFYQPTAGDYTENILHIDPYTLTNVNMYWDYRARNSRSSSYLIMLDETIIQKSFSLHTEADFLDIKSEGIVAIHLAYDDLSEPVYTGSGYHRVTLGLPKTEYEITIVAHSLAILDYIKFGYSHITQERYKTDFHRNQYSSERDNDLMPNWSLVEQLGSTTPLSGLWDSRVFFASPFQQGDPNANNGLLALQNTYGDTQHYLAWTPEDQIVSSNFKMSWTWTPNLFFGLPEEDCYNYFEGSIPTITDDVPAYYSGVRKEVPSKAIFSIMFANGSNMDITLTYGWSPEWNYEDNYETKSIYLNNRWLHVIVDKGGPEIAHNTLYSSGSDYGTLFDIIGDGVGEQVVDNWHDSWPDNIDRANPLAYGNERGYDIDFINYNGKMWILIENSLIYCGPAFSSPIDTSSGSWYFQSVDYLNPAQGNYYGTMLDQFSFSPVVSFDENKWETLGATSYQVYTDGELLLLPHDRASGNNLQSIKSTASYSVEEMPDLKFQFVYDHVIPEMIIATQPISPEDYQSGDMMLEFRNLIGHNLVDLRQANLDFNYNYLYPDDQGNQATGIEQSTTIPFNATYFRDNAPIYVEFSIILNQTGNGYILEVRIWQEGQIRPNTGQMGYFSAPYLRNTVEFYIYQWNPWDLFRYTYVDEEYKERYAHKDWLYYNQNQLGEINYAYQGLGASTVPDDYSLPEGALSSTLSLFPALVRPGILRIDDFELCLISVEENPVLKSLALQGSSEIGDYTLQGEGDYSIKLWSEEALTYNFYAPIDNFGSNWTISIWGLFPNEFTSDSYYQLVSSTDTWTINLCSSSSGIRTRIGSEYSDNTVPYGEPFLLQINGNYTDNKFIFSVSLNDEIVHDFQEMDISPTEIMSLNFRCGDEYSPFYLLGLRVSERNEIDLSSDDILDSDSWVRPSSGSEISEEYALGPRYLALSVRALDGDTLVSFKINGINHTSTKLLSYSDNYSPKSLLLDIPCSFEIDTLKANSFTIFTNGRIEIVSVSLVNVNPVLNWLSSINDQRKMSNHYIDDFSAQDIFTLIEDEFTGDTLTSGTLASLNKMWKVNIDDNMNSPSKITIQQVGEMIGDDYLTSLIEDNEFHILSQHGIGTDDFGWTSYYRDASTNSMDINAHEDWGGWAYQAANLTYEFTGDDGDWINYLNVDDIAVDTNFLKINQTAGTDFFSIKKEFAFWGIDFTLSMAQTFKSKVYVNETVAEPTSLTIYYYLIDGSYVKSDPITLTNSGWNYIDYCFEDQFTSFSDASSEIIDYVELKFNGQIANTTQYKIDYLDFSGYSFRLNPTGLGYQDYDNFLLYDRSEIIEHSSDAYSISTTVYPWQLEEGCYAGLAFHVFEDSSNNWKWHSFVIKNQGSGSITSQFIVGGEGGTIYDLSYEANNKPLTLKVEVDGDLIRFYINDVLLAEKSEFYESLWGDRISKQFDYGLEGYLMTTFRNRGSFGLIGNVGNDAFHFNDWHFIPEGDDVLLLSCAGNEKQDSSINEWSVPSLVTDLPTGSWVAETYIEDYNYYKSPNDNGDWLFDLNHWYSFEEDEYVKDLDSPLSDFDFSQFGMLLYYDYDNWLGFGPNRDPLQDINDGVGDGLPYPNYWKYNPVPEITMKGVLGNTDTKLLRTTNWLDASLLCDTVTSNSDNPYQKGALDGFDGLRLVYDEVSNQLYCYYHTFIYHDFETQYTKEEGWYLAGIIQLDDLDLDINRFQIGLFTNRWRVSGETVDTLQVAFSNFKVRSLDLNNLNIRGWETVGMEHFPVSNDNFDLDSQPNYLWNIENHNNEDVLVCRPGSTTVDVYDGSSTVSQTIEAGVSVVYPYSGLNNPSSLATGSYYVETSVKMEGITNDRFGFVVGADNDILKPLYTDLINYNYIFDLPSSSAERYTVIGIDYLSDTYFKFCATTYTETGSYSVHSDPIELSTSWADFWSSWVKVSLEAELITDETKSVDLTIRFGPYSFSTNSNLEKLGRPGLFIDSDSEAYDSDKMFLFNYFKADQDPVDFFQVDQSLINLALPLDDTTGSPSGRYFADIDLDLIQDTWSWHSTSAEIPLLLNYIHDGRDVIQIQTEAEAYVEAPTVQELFNGDFSDTQSFFNSWWDTHDAAWKYEFALGFDTTYIDWYAQSLDYSNREVSIPTVGNYEYSWLSFDYNMDLGEQAIIYVAVDCGVDTNGDGAPDNSVTVWLAYYITDSFDEGIIGHYETGLPLSLRQNDNYMADDALDKDARFIRPILRAGVPNIELYHQGDIPTNTPYTDLVFAQAISPGNGDFQSFFRDLSNEINTVNSWVGGQQTSSYSGWKDTPFIHFTDFETADYYLNPDDDGDGDQDHPPHVNYLDSMLFSNLFYNGIKTIHVATDNDIIELADISLSKTVNPYAIPYSGASSSFIEYDEEIISNLDGSLTSIWSEVETDYSGTVNINNLISSQDSTYTTYFTSYIETTYDEEIHCLIRATSNWALLINDRLITSHSLYSDRMTSQDWSDSIGSFNTDFIEVTTKLHAGINKIGLFLHKPAQDSLLDPLEWRFQFLTISSSNASLTINPNGIDSSVTSRGFIRDSLISTPIQLPDISDYTSLSQNIDIANLRAYEGTDNTYNDISRNLPIDGEKWYVREWATLPEDLQSPTYAFEWLRYLDQTEESDQYYNTSGVFWDFDNDGLDTLVYSNDVSLSYTIDGTLQLNDLSSSFWLNFTSDILDYDEEYDFIDYSLIDPMVHHYLKIEYRISASDLIISLRNSSDISEIFADNLQDEMVFDGVWHDANIFIDWASNLTRSGFVLCFETTDDPLPEIELDSLYFLSDIVEDINDVFIFDYDQIMKRETVSEWGSPSEGEFEDKTISVLYQFNYFLGTPLYETIQFTLKTYDENTNVLITLDGSEKNWLSYWDDPLSPSYSTGKVFHVLPFSQAGSMGFHRITIELTHTFENFNDSTLFDTTFDLSFQISKVSDSLILLNEITDYSRGDHTRNGVSQGFKVRRDVDSPYTAEEEAPPVDFFDDYPGRHILGTTLWHDASGFHSLRFQTLGIDDYKLLEDPSQNLGTYTGNMMTISIVDYGTSHTQVLLDQHWIATGDINNEYLYNIEWNSNKALFSDRCIDQQFDWSSRESGLFIDGGSFLLSHSDRPDDPSLDLALDFYRGGNTWVQSDNFFTKIIDKSDFQFKIWNDDVNHWDHVIIELLTGQRIILEGDDWPFLNFEISPSQSLFGEALLSISGISQDNYQTSFDLTHLLVLNLNGIDTITALDLSNNRQLTYTPNLQQIELTGLLGNSFRQAELTMNLRYRLVTLHYSDAESAMVSNPANEMFIYSVVTSDQNTPKIASPPTVGYFPEASGEVIDKPTWYENIWYGVDVNDVLCWQLASSYQDMGLNEFGILPIFQWVFGTGGIVDNAFLMGENKFGDFLGWTGLATAGQNLFLSGYRVIANWARWSLIKNNYVMGSVASAWSILAFVALINGDVQFIKSSFFSIAAVYLDSYLTKLGGMWSVVINALICLGLSIDVLTDWLGLKLPKMGQWFNSVGEGIIDVLNWITESVPDGVPLDSDEYSDSIADQGSLVLEEGTFENKEPSDWDNFLFRKFAGKVIFDILYGMLLGTGIGFDQESYGIDVLFKGRDSTKEGVGFYQVSNVVNLNIAFDRHGDSQEFVKNTVHMLASICGLTIGYDDYTMTVIRDEDYNELSIFDFDKYDILARRPADGRAGEYDWVYFYGLRDFLSFSESATWSLNKVLNDFLSKGFFDCGAGDFAIMLFAEMVIGMMKWRHDLLGFAQDIRDALFGDTIFDQMIGLIMSSVWLLNGGQKVPGLNKVSSGLKKGIGKLVPVKSIIKGAGKSISKIGRIKFVSNMMQKASYKLLKFSYGTAGAGIRGKFINLGLLL